MSDNIVSVRSSENAYAWRNSNVTVRTGNDMKDAAPEMLLTSTMKGLSRGRLFMTRGDRDGIGDSQSALQEWKRQEERKP